MEQQIADLLRQNQDLIRALQIREDSHSHKVTVQFDKFDEENENFDSFIERFETYLDVQNVPIANRAKVFVSSLSAKLYQLLKNLLAPDIPSDQTLDKLKDALKKHLTPKPLIIPSRHKFLNRKQTEGEDWPAIKAFRAKTEQNLNNLLREYKDIFDDKLGEINNYEAKLKLRHGVKPIFCRVRTVPFALKGRVENEIDRLEKEGIIEKVDSSEWATPVVPVVKSDGSIRLCADYSVTLNPNLIVPQHPLPRLDEIFGSLNGGKQFTKLDFKHAYLQMKVHPDSQKLMTINTHKGLYICKRLMYGLNGAPAIWKRYVDGLFQATIANPLNNLTKKKNVRFLWSKDCQVAFEQIKKEICSPKILVHYDPSLPLTLASDASPVGIGCVLSHVYPDGSERPIAFASRTLSGSEKKYSQIDKEALSIVWASFEFDIIFRKTIEHGNADFLSRLPKTSEELEVKDDITIFQMSQIEALPVTSKELRQETSKDIELGPLLRALREGKDLQGREAQYTIEDGCIMYGQRVCIPRKFRKNVLEELHAGHLGIVKMKAIARSFVYWKNIDNDIEEAAKNCVDCARYKADPPKSKVHYWEYPSMPWERIHVDFAGPIFEHTFFLIVDAHSKWLEVYPMKVTTTKKTIECLRDSFARFGLPRVLVSDNGSQFTSYEFQRFMHKNGVRHKTSAPFKPSSNGQAERYVATLKQSLRAMHKYEGTIQQKLSTFLMQYRKAPNDKLRRDNFEFRDRKFDVGDRVAVRVYRAANTRWKFGTIVNQDGVLHYIIDVQGTLVRRHVDQIRPVGDKVQENIIPLMHQRFPENNSNIQHAETAEDISKDLNKELGSSFIQGVPSTDVAVPDLSQSSAKETDSETRSPPVPDRPFPRRSGRIRRPPERLVL
ncbi:uncharacterized protein K02A2.6 [Trichonephila clavipes]|nr:uncharacterized protein K02A2.6 [Trichonephila clavipes]